MPLSRPQPLTVGVAAGLVLSLMLIMPITDRLDVYRELFFDWLTQWIDTPRTSQIAVIDLDLKSAHGGRGRKFERSDVAEIISKLSKSGALVIAVDIIFSESCDPSTKANNLLAKAIASAPVILGFLLSDNSIQRPRPIPPVAVKRPIRVPTGWFIDGAEKSCTAFEGGARAAAAAYLVGDEDAHIRRVQPYSILGNQAYPALGLEAARLALGGRIPIIKGSPLSIQFARRIIKLDDSGNLRFVASSSKTIGERTISAVDFLENRIPLNYFAGKVIFVGSSIPQRGGLRPTASMPLQPSVQIHADVANALITGFVPHRTRATATAEAWFAFWGALLLVLVATKIHPLASAALCLGFISITVAIAMFIYSNFGLLIDAIGIALLFVTVFGITSTVRFARVYRREASARSRFSQYLPATVVNRYIDDPRGNLIGSEERLITALFTDIGGFSKLSRSLAPRDLVTMLNIYVTEVIGLVVAYGGMVDKVSGDAIHAFFNAPDDLEDHVDKALDCAAAIHALTEEMRTRQPFAQHNFGGTRIGIETGTAVLGEIGSGSKLDYTAHGDAINLAARLQEANKFLGTSICIGPNVAAQSSRTLIALGTHEIRDFGRIDLFTINYILDWGRQPTRKT